MKVNVVFGKYPMNCLLQDDWILVGIGLQSHDLSDQLLNSDIHEALKGFRIEEIYDSSLFEEVILFQKQKYFWQPLLR